MFSAYIIQNEVARGASGAKVGGSNPLAPTMFSAYILQSEKTQRYYTGSTDNLENRLEEHNSGETKSIRFGIPWKVVHVEQFETRAEAFRKEKQIKARGAKRYLDDRGNFG
jgi:putative endonuclease